MNPYESPTTLPADAGINQTSEPIASYVASYEESRLEGKRHFELQDAGVFVSGSMVLGARFEVIIPYSDICTPPSRLWIRNQLFLYSLGCALICPAVSFGIAEALNISVFKFLPGLLLALSVIAVFVAFVTYKPVEYVRYCSAAGVPILDIARSGPTADQFDDFTNTISHRATGRKNGT